MKRVTLSDTQASTNPPQIPGEYWLDDACILDMDYFVKTLSGIKAKGVRPDLVGSIIAHYASKWVPELSESPNIVSNSTESNASPESATTSWRKKKFFIETLVGILPPENDAISCNFLFKLLRVANKVGVDISYIEELESRASWRLEEASLMDIMMPSFNHTCGTLLDFELVLRLVKRFVALDESVKGSSALIKVAKVIDSYLAEVALDLKLSLEDFIELAGVLPPHARAIDDGLYRAIDTYLKVHSGVPKQERKLLCRLIDSRKLSPEASLHASQNERLPLRAVVQVLFSEQNKINHKLESSGSLVVRSPSQMGFELSARCHSKREVTVQNMEIKRLKEDVLRLQNQMIALQGQLEKLVEKKRGFFRWKKLLLISGSVAVNDGARSESIGNNREFEEVGFGRHTPLAKEKPKTKVPNSRTSRRWRKSLS
ncbi:root phototropism protein 3-like [Silene latifolia]|uniref:root phototropism protein 3-like n=1 Tax=Silene latifolia TaxID=37657 RepID=UPI003D77C678